MRFVVDHQPTPFQAGDSLLVAMLRAGLHPTGGGCLCLAGDCCHCLATVDGVAYARTCQISARPGLVVERDHRHGETPPVIRHQGDEFTSTPEVSPAICHWTEHSPNADNNRHGISAVVLQGLFWYHQYSAELCALIANQPPSRALSLGNVGCRNAAQNHPDQSSVQRDEDVVPVLYYLPSK